MNSDDLYKFINDGESQTVEFKQIFPTHEKIAKEIIAFANTQGGKIIFGVKDNGKIIGVHSEKEIAELVNETVSEFCEPPVNIELEYFEHDFNEIVVVDIPESKTKPHRIQDYKNDLDIRTAQVYIRVNDKSVPASAEMIRLMRAAVNKKPLVKYAIGKDEKKVFEYLEINERINVKDLCSFSNISKRRASRTLVKMVRAGLLHLHTKDNGDEYFTYIKET